jgi:pSer/pThr/pTyr-binding forkhead associated (FHA) protein
MKLSLIVQTPGKWEGKAIPIKLTQFVIGRDPNCHLRPANLLISKRHCVLLIRGDKAFVRDLDSTNGTFINDQPVESEIELHDRDCLKVGTVAFGISISGAAPVAKSAAPPPPPAKVPDLVAEEEDAAAATLLLSMQDEVTPPNGTVDKDGVPTGSTVLENLSGLLPAEGAVKPEEEKSAESKPPAKSSEADTSKAAKALLEKYIRRPRG